MVTYRDALTRVLKSFPRPPSESVNLDRVAGRNLASDVLCKYDVPNFTNSAVDGYAVSAADLRKNGPLRVVGTLGAGNVPTGEVVAGETVRVMTGAPLPQGSAAVVMQEDVDVLEGAIRLMVDLTPGRNVREQGREFTAGSVVLTAGTRVTPPVVSLLAGLGYDRVEVLGVPKVAILATGDELVSPGQSLASGQVYESNTFGIAAALRKAGIEPTLSRACDDRQAVVDTLISLFETHDVVLTCGGLSVGLFDHVRDALASLGFRFEVERVAIKPGKPFSFATGQGCKTVFCLPGNPMSALVTFALFVWPALVPPGPGAEYPLSSDYTNPGDRTEFVPARLTVGTDGRLHVEPAPTMGSHALSGLVGCDAMIEVPPGSALSAGERTSVIMLPWSSLC